MLVTLVAVMICPSEDYEVSHNDSAGNVAGFFPTNLIQRQQNCDLFFWIITPPNKKKTQDSSDSTSQCHPMCVGLHQVVASARDELLRWVWQKYPGSLSQFLNVQVILFNGFLRKLRTENPLRTRHFPPALGQESILAPGYQTVGWCSVIGYD